jgi:hypothetical protein
MSRTSNQGTVRAQSGTGQIHEDGPPVQEKGKGTTKSKRPLALLVAGAVIAALLSIATAAPSFALCSNKPPDYPGCTPAQLVPGSIKLAKREFTGHQKFYRHHQWGQHQEGAVYKGISAKTNNILAVKYGHFVKKYRHHNHGHYPFYHNWKRFKAGAYGACMRLRKRNAPDKYCNYTAPGTYQITGIKQSGASDPNWHFVSKCNGTMVGGAAGGATLGAIATVAGGEETGGLLILGGAASGATSAVVGCQVTSLYHWMFGSDKLNRPWGYE